MTAQNESGLVVVLRRLRHFYKEAGGKHRFSISNGEDIYFELEPADVERVYDPAAPRGNSTQCFEPPIEQYRENVQIVFAEGVEYNGVDLGKYKFGDEDREEFRIPYSVIELIAESQNDNRYRVLASFGGRLKPQAELPY